MCVCVCTQGVKDHTHNVARLTVSLLVHSVEGFASQLAAAGHAHKAVHMEDLIHGSAASAFTNHILPTARTATCNTHIIRSQTCTQTK